jgi:hypothetical protein
MRAYRLEQAKSDYRAICVTAGLAVEGARWSAKTVYYRLLASGHPSDFGTVDAIVSAWRASHRCAEITLHPRPRAACELGTQHEGCCPGKCAA